jgi:hypothetical protein
MAITSKNPQIADFHFHQPCFARPPQNSMIQRPVKKIRKNADEVNLHLKPKKTFTASLRALRSGG